MASQEAPWTQPKFLIAAVLVIALIVLGAVLALGGRDDADGGASATTAATATTPVSAGAGVESVCGLPGYTDSGTLTTPPAAEWLFQGTTAYPTAPEYGPGAATPEGARYCFQHTPTGALFAAANAMVQASDPETAEEWLEYAVAEGPYRDEITNREGAMDESASRISIAGFRLLAYDGNHARVDLAVRATSGTSTIFVSGVYELVWQDGDWKISADAAEPLNVASIPDLAGYITWGA